MNRRTFLSCSGLAVAGGLAGCTGGADETPDGVILPRVELGNASSTPQTFHVLVEYNGELDHWASYEIEPTVGQEGMGSELIDPELPPDPALITAYVRVGEERAAIDFEAEGYSEGKCVIATFLYGFRGDDILSAHPTSLADSGRVADEVDCPAGTDEE